MSGFSEGDRRELRSRVRAAQHESAQRGRPVCAWLSRPLRGLDPGGVFAAAGAGERFSWEPPDASVRFVAAGAVSTLEGSGFGRLRDVAEQAAALFAGSAPLPASPLDGPLLTGGFAFSSAGQEGAWRGFAPARFVLPEHLVVARADRASHTVAILARPHGDADALVSAAEASWRALADPMRRGAPSSQARIAERDETSPTFRASATPSPERFRALVRRALDAIRDGRFEKVVLARCCTLSRSEGFDADRVFDALRAANPSCFRVAVGFGGATLLAATPERPLRVDGREIRTSALAGSAPRGRSPEEDARLAAQLRESKKEQEEHALVVRALRGALEACCERLSVPESPEVLRLDAISHLHTPIAGRLRADAPRSILELAALVHPSPAVAGAPRAAALAWLRANERASRGWYAGAIGWFAPGGDGELAVALRTLLLRGDDALLHAGAGIVAGSSPEGELEETRLKLRGGLAALLEL